MAYAFNKDKSKYDLDPLIDTLFKVVAAYAVFDSSDGSLTFFRDVAGKYTNEQVIGTKTYYTGIENTSDASDAYADIPWYTKRRNIFKVTFEDIIRPKSCAFWFYEMPLTSIENIKLLDTSKTINMNRMFYHVLHEFDAMDLSGFDTSNVRNMTGMFELCGNTMQLNLSSFDTSNVTNMDNMFTNCRNLRQLDLSGFNTSNLTNTYKMFDSCSNLTQLNLSGFDTSNVTNMGYMFRNCRNLRQLDLSGFDTSNVTHMGDMFKGCTNVTATLAVAKMPTIYGYMCAGASSQSGQLTLKYKAPVTSANIDTLVSTKGDGNVVNGGEA